LFHFKQALFREAQSEGFMKKELKELTQNIISELGKLCWLDDLSVIENEFTKIRTKYEKTKHKSLIDYYQKNWLPRLKLGLINYSDIEDHQRANSVIEKYNCHIKDSLPRSPSWPKFVEFLTKEEANYVKESFNAEQLGKVSVKSINFSKTYLPKPLKNKKKAQYEITVQENVNEQEKSNSSTKKRKQRDFDHDLKLKQMKLNSDNLMEQKGNGNYMYNKHIREESNYKSTNKKSSQNENQIISDLLSFKSPWLRWNRNSCRYDSFISVFAFHLFSEYKEFRRENVDKRHKHVKNYWKLCDLAENLIRTSEMQTKQNLIQEFWEYAFKSKIDEVTLGAPVFVQQLLSFFQPLLRLQPFINEKKTCSFCEFSESNKVRWSLPIKIHDVNHLKLTSLQQYFDWYLELKNSERCDICLQDRLEVQFEYQDFPSLIVIEFISSTGTRLLNEKQFEYNDILIDKTTKSQFKIVASINQPYENHFNCCFSVSSPLISKKDELKWVFHDGLENDGKLLPIDNLQEIWAQKPILFFYKKV